MFENPFDEKLAELKEGKCDTLLVTRDQFTLFRECWAQREDRMHFVGEAGLNGQIIYRYVK